MGFFSSIFKAVVSAAEKVGAKGGFFSNLLMITNPLAAFAVNFIGSMIVSTILSKVFAKKPKANFQKQLSARSEMIKQAIITRDTVYGESKKSGAILYMETTDNTKRMHLVGQIASHEIQSFDKIYFNQIESIKLNILNYIDNSILLRIF